MNINIAFIGLLFLLYNGNEISSTQLLLLLALISASNTGCCQSGNRNDFSSSNAASTALN